MVAIFFILFGLVLFIWLCVGTAWVAIEYAASADANTKPDPALAEDGSTAGTMSCPVYVSGLATFVIALRWIEFAVAGIVVIIGYCIKKEMSDNKAAGEDV